MFTRAALFALLLIAPALAAAQPRLMLDELPSRLVFDEAPPEAVSTRDAPTLPHAERLLLESAGGLSGALAFGVASGFAGLLLACPAGLNASPSCLRGIGWGALVGVALAAPPGVFLSGRLLRGSGSFLPTLGGGLVGIGAVLVLAPFAPAVLPLLVFGLPVIGSVAGYELSAAWHTYHTPAAALPAEPPGGAPAMAVISRF